MASAFRKLDLDVLKRDIEAKFERVRVAEVKPKVTTEEKAEILYRAAIRQLR